MTKFWMALVLVLVPHLVLAQQVEVSKQTSYGVVSGADSQVPKVNAYAVIEVNMQVPKVNAYAVVTSLPSAGGNVFRAPFTHP